MYKTTGCLSEIVTMSNNKLKDIDDTHVAEQHQLLRKGPFETFYLFVYFITRAFFILDSRK
jgi:hypothetical protein